MVDRFLGLFCFTAPRPGRREAAHFGSGPIDQAEVDISKADDELASLGLGDADWLASQDVAAGTKIDRATIVHAVVSNGLGSVPTAGAQQATTTAVPGVIGQRFGGASSSLTNAGFVVLVQYATQAVGNGTIIAQDPAPGTQLAQGEHVTVTLSVPGAIPDTDGMAVEQARNA